jgi:hypothetical protein
LSDVPSLTEFNPHAIPYQFRVIKDVRALFDYELGTHEVLLSGSVGSAKSVLMAHIIVTHCLFNAGARFLIGRLTMPDLKETIFQTILDHLEGDLVEGVDYKVNYTSAKITFLKNKSEIISRSWADKKFKKFRSVKLSGACIEELTENTDAYKQFYTEVLTRLQRLPHVKENVIICATNPDAPSHWAYRHFISTDVKTRHVYYSRTEDNPFLARSYIEQLKRDLDPKMARRLLYGEWIEITTEIIYYSYDHAHNFINRDYEFDLEHPVSLSFDFNIGVGKPMSAVSSQFIADVFHWAEDYVVEGADTEELLDEIAARGLFELPVKFLIHGDASGKSRDTRSKTTDYRIILEFMSKYRRADGSRLDFEMMQPKGNPPIRTRHNAMNGYMLNSEGQRRFFVYRKAKTLDEGCRLTKLKPGGQYLEDDSPHYQHVTTAAGYALVSQTINAPSTPTAYKR